MKANKIFIINPDTNAPVSVEDWKKDTHPARAEWVLVETDELKPFRLHKKLAENGTFFTFDKALDAGNTLTRAQGIALYEAKNTAGLNEAMQLIGGDPIQGWMWTCESDTYDSQHTAAYAWGVGLAGGYVLNRTETAGYQVRLVSAFEIS